MKLFKRLQLFCCALLSVLFSGNVFASDPVIDSLLSRLNSTSDSAKVDVLITLSYRHIQRDTAKSDHYRNLAFNQSVSLNYKKGLGWCQYLHGMRYLQQSRYLSAINMETQAISLGQSVKDYELIARAHNTIGIANLRLDDEYNALKSFKNAIKTLEKAKDRSFEGAFIGNLGIAYIKDKDIKRGLYYLKKASVMHKRTGNKVWLSDNYLETGYAYEQLHDYEQARLYGQKSLFLAREVKLASLEVHPLILLGSVHIKLNNLDSAKVYLDQAMTMAKGKNSSLVRLKIYKSYASLYEKQRNFPLAYFYQKESMLLDDTLDNAVRDKIILEYQEKFRAQQKELENKGLREEQGKKDIQIRQKNTLIHQIYVVLGIFILFSFFIYWANRRIREKNRLLILKSAEILRQKEQVEYINHIKDKLFSIIAHDLRSPFASMKSMIELYDDGLMSTEEAGFFLKEVSREVGSNNLLLDNLLVWAKSQLHGFKINPRSISLRSITKEAIYPFSKLMAEKNLTINNHIQKDCLAFADHEMIKTVLRNLIGNAIKFTSDSGNITVSCSKRYGELTISVADSGIGIEREQLQKLFQDGFVTTDGLKNEKGTGLGLKICKEFVEKNNGKIWIESIIDIGSTIYFTLPESSDAVVSQNALEETTNV